MIDESVVIVLDDVPLEVTIGDDELEDEVCWLELGSVEDDSLLPPRPSKSKMSQLESERAISGSNIDIEIGVTVEALQQDVDVTFVGTKAN